MRYPMTSVLILLVMVVACSPQRKEPQSRAEQPQEAATRALDTMRGLVTAQNYKVMGFESEDEVKSAALGEGLAVYHIPLDRLREYQPGTDPNGLLSDVGQMIYPVVVNERARSSIIIAREGNGWKEASFGGPSVIKAISQARATDLATGQQTRGSYSVVQVPALRMYFLARRVENRLIFIPVVDDPAEKFKAGVPIPAEEVLQSLVAIAKSYNGLPD